MCKASELCSTVISNALTKTRTQLGPCHESGFPSWVYRVKVLHHLLGSKGEQHILAAASSRSSNKRVKSPCDGTVAQNRHPSSSKTTGEQTRRTTNKFRAVSSHLARSMADLVSKNGRFGAVFRTIVLKVRDDRQCVKWAVPMRAIVLPQRSGHQRNANGWGIRLVPCRGATGWAISS